MGHKHTKPYFPPHYKQPPHVMPVYPVSDEELKKFNERLKKIKNKEIPDSRFYRRKLPKNPKPFRPV